MPSSDAAFYLPEADGSLRATEWTRGPWSEHHQHAGPVTASMARAMSRVVPELVAARFTMELLKPIPIGRMHIEVGAAEGGASVRRVAASLRVDGVLVARGLGLFVAPRAGDMPVVGPEAPRLEVPGEDAPSGFDFFRWEIGYHRAIDLRYARGRLHDTNVVAWIRARVALVAGEVPSGVERVMIAADSGNGVTASLDFTKYDFLNADLTVHLGRPPSGEWIALEAEMRTADNGQGLVQTRLHDEAGVIGAAAQSLLVRPTRR